MKINLSLIINVFAIVLFIGACTSAGGDNPGTEYMPDMGHSTGYEAHTYDYYKYNRWGGEEDYYNYAQPRLPVKGTIARGQMPSHAPSYRSGVSVSHNGSVPYYYIDTEDERTRAMNEITSNPYPITDEGLERGKNLYNVNCGICHGEKGDGNGFLISEDNPNQVYPSQPAIFTSDDFINSSEGRYYHSIMYGKNVMGSYKDKLSWEERWQVIHYIRALQAKEKKLAYNELENTLNSIGIPASTIAKTVHVMDEEDADHEGHEINMDDHNDHGDEDHDGNEHH